MAAPLTNSIDDHSTNSSRPTGGVIVDIGTGDGRFVYQSARANPDKFYIGIDASPKALTKISEKIHRKPSKGGAPNVLFVQSAIESLPEELNGVADEVHVHFPWGSLLGAVATGDVSALSNLRRICAPQAWLEIIIGFDPLRDRAELERLAIEPLSEEFIRTTLRVRYAASSFAIRESGVLAPADWPHLETSWAQRLKGSDSRSLLYLIAQAIF